MTKPFESILDPFMKTLMETRESLRAKVKAGEIRASEASGFIAVTGSVIKYLVKLHYEKADSKLHKRAVRGSITFTELKEQAATDAETLPGRLAAEARRKDRLMGR